MMMQNINKYAKLICTVLGALSVLALPPYYMFFVLILGLSGLFYFLTEAQNAKQSFAMGYWFGFGFFAVGFSWIANALLIDVEQFGWLYLVVIFACGAFFGLFTALPSWLAFYFKNILNKFAAFCCLMVLSEWVRSFILTGFPWNLLGSTLAFEVKLLQPAAFVGTYGLSLLVLLFCTAPALYWVQKNRKYAVICVGIMLGVAVVVGLSSLRYQNYVGKQDSDTRLRLVQPSIPQDLKWNMASLEQNFQKHIALSTQKGIKDIDFIIWSETASPFPLDIDLKHQQQLRNALQNRNTLVTGSVRYEIDAFGKIKMYNSMFAVDKRGVVGSYDKMHLVPFGEYIPLRKYFPAWIKPLTNVIADLTAGTERRNIKTKNQPAFGSLICYEIIFPHQIIDKKNRPEWLVSLTNDAWYGDSMGPRQHFVAAQLRAVEEGLSIARVAGSGISGLISPYGQVLGKLDLNKEGILDINLPSQTNIATPYSRNGNLPILLICLSILLVSVFYEKKSKNS